MSYPHPNGSFDPPQPYPGQAYGYPQQPGQQYGSYSPVATQFAHAGWWSRAAASLIDVIVVAGPVYGLLGLGILASGGSTDNFSILGNVLTLVGLLTSAGAIVWQFYREGTTGQSLGKRALGIRLLREGDGQPLGVGMAVVRRLAHIVDSLACYIGWLLPIWDAKKQTFADKMVNSVVVKAR